MSNLGISAACRAAGISRDLVYQEMRRGLTLDAAIEAARRRTMRPHRERGHGGSPADDMRERADALSGLV